MMGCAYCRYLEDPLVTVKCRGFAIDHLLSHDGEHIAIIGRRGGKADIMQLPVKAFIALGQDIVRDAVASKMLRAQHPVPLPEEPSSSLFVAARLINHPGDEATFVDLTAESEEVQEAMVAGAGPNARRGRA